MRLRCLAFIILIAVSSSPNVSAQDAGFFPEDPCQSYLGYWLLSMEEIHEELSVGGRLVQRIDTLPEVIGSVGDPPTYRMCTLVDSTKLLMCYFDQHQRLRATRLIVQYRSTSARDAALKEAKKEAARVYTSHIYNGQVTGWGEGCSGELAVNVDIGKGATRPPVPMAQGKTFDLNITLTTTVEFMLFDLGSD